MSIGTVRDIQRTALDGGYLCYRVVADTPDGQVRRCSFNGNMFVGPVLLFSAGDAGRLEMLIHRPRRFGEFATQDWVHRFFAEWHQHDGFTEHLRDVAAEWLATGYRARRVG